MLGWGVIIYKKSEPETGNFEDSIAFWECGLGGDDWIRKHCEKVEDNGGYPTRYRTNGEFIKRVLRVGTVKHISGVTVIHEEEGIVEFAGQDGWIGRERLDAKRLQAIEDDEVILIDTWDLS